MSTTIDQKVVEMRFDNRQFESNVSTTMSTLDKLKQSLKFTGATKGLEEVDAASRKLDFSEIENTACRAGWSIRDVWLKTSQIFEYQVARRIVNAAQNIAKSLTIEPVMTGFKEYETQINAIQTILANTESKGTTLEDVNSALDELNAYADKTIYNFTEMTRNIGTFTAAGTDLETSVSAIKGIANLAAVSGSNSQQASTAMYQLSQAMASGTVKLMDWNSVVNAGMGGQVFQDALKETARVHGVAVDDMIKKHGSFRESLSEGWITTEILTETLSKFTMSAEEGSEEWNAYMETLKSKGYTEEQAEKILKMGNTATDAATKVKTFTQLWDTLKEAAQSGWSQTWEILVGDFEEAKELLTSISDVVGNFINKMSESRNEVLENWKVLGGRDDLLESFKNIFNGILDIIKPITEAFTDMFPPITAERLMAVTTGFKEFTSNLRLSDTASDNLKRTFKGLFAVVDIVWQIFKGISKVIKPIFGIIVDLVGGILGATAGFGDWLVILDKTAKSGDIFGKVFGGIATILEGVHKVGAKVVGFVKEKIAAPGWELLHTLLGKLHNAFTSLLEIAGIMESGVSKSFDAIGAAISGSSIFKILKSLWDVILAIGSGLGKVLGNLMSKLGKGDFAGVFDLINSLIAGGIGIRIAGFIKSLKESVDSFSGIFEGFGDTLEAFQSKLKAEALKTIATAILILAAALLVLSLIDKDKLAGAIGTMTMLFVEIGYFMSIMGRFKKLGLAKTTAAIVNLATALLIMAIAMNILGSMSWSELAKGLIGLTVGLGALVVAVNLLPDTKVNSAAKAIKKLASALLILSIALKIMGTMSWEEMAVALVSLVSGLGALVLAVNLLPKDTALKVAGLVSLSTALLILAAALKVMSTMSWEEMAISLVALAGSLAILIVAMSLMKSALPGALAMLIIAPALILFAAALSILGAMGWESMAISLVALAGGLLILAGAMYLMQGALPGALAILIIAPALVLLAAALSILGAMSWESIAKGLVSLAGAFLIIGVAGAVLGPLVPAILGLAGAMILIGVGVLAAGVGLLAFGAGLSALAVGFTTLVASLGTVVLGIRSIITAIVVGAVQGLGEGIVALCQVLIDGAPAICEALAVIIISLCDAIIASVPALIECIHVLLSELLIFIVDFVPELVVAGIELIIGLLDGISQNVGKLAAAAVELIVTFLKAIASMQLSIINAGIKIMIDFVNGMADGIRENTPKLLSAVNNLMSSVAEAIGMAIGNVPVMGKQIVSGLIKGIKSSAGELFSSMLGVVKDAWNGVLNFLGIHSPSRLAADAGKNIDDGLAVGLKKYAGAVDKAATNVGETAISSISNTVGKVSDIINSDMDTQPTIRPVLDLSDVESGAGAISGLLGGSSVGVMASVGAISSMMGQNGQNGGNSEVVSEIKKLRKDLGHVNSETININGVTYDDGSNITEAVRSIVRAAKVERRR